MGTAKWKTAIWEVTAYTIPRALITASHSCAVKRADFLISDVDFMPVTQCFISIPCSTNRNFSDKYERLPLGRVCAETLFEPFVSVCVNAASGMAQILRVLVLESKQISGHVVVTLNDNVAVAPFSAVKYSCLRGRFLCEV